MDKTMLRRALWEFLRPLIQLITNLLNPEIGEEWLTELKKFLRREPCWVAAVESAREAKVYLKTLFTDVEVGPTDGVVTEKRAHRVFSGYIDPRFLAFKGKATEAMPFAVSELVENGKFLNFFGKTAAKLELRRSRWGQVIKFAEDHPDKLRKGGYATFFLLTEDDEPVKEDLSNVFVAKVDVDGRSRLYAGWSSFSDGYVWDAGYAHRLVSPQQ